MNHVSGVLKSLLKRRRISQAQLAKTVSTTRPTICRICNGRTAATRKRLSALSEALAETRSERAELWVAYLHDELRALGAKEEEIRAILRPSGDVDEALLVPLRLRSTFRRLLHNATQPEASDLRDLLGSLSQLIAIAPPITDLLGPGPLTKTAS